MRTHRQGIACASGSCSASSTESRRWRTPDKTRTVMELAHYTPGTRPYLDLTFPPAPVDRPHIIVNMVGSIDGKAVLDGTEQGLGSAQDKSRMQELRAHADAVMNGAGTMRKSGASSRIDDPALVQWRREHGKHTDFPLGC